jgi:hypothetical protein
MIVAADLIDQHAQDRRADRTAKTGTAADESEEPLRLTRVVDLSGERPELADEKHAKQKTERVQTNRDPHGAGLQ